MDAMVSKEKVCAKKTGDHWGYGGRKWCGNNTYSFTFFCLFVRMWAISNRICGAQ